MEDENLIHSSEQAKVVLSGNFELIIISLPLSEFVRVASLVTD